MSQLWAVVVFVGRSSKRIAVSVVGIALILAGLAGIVLPLLPGPLLVIAGLAVLATEYVWARRALEATKNRFNQARGKVRARRARKRGSGPGAPPTSLDEGGPTLIR